MLETLGLGRVYAITCLKVVILIRKRLCSRLVQEPRSQVIPGLRYKAMCEMWSIIGRLRFFVYTECCESGNLNLVLPIMSIISYFFAYVSTLW